MFRPVDELAALRPRPGELIARELVEASLERIEALDGDVNAFVDVYADGALAAGRRGRPGDRAPVRRRPDRDQEQPRRSPGMRLTSARSSCGDFVARPRRAPSSGGCARRASSSSARPTLPEYGILPVDRAARASGPRATRGTPSRTPGGSSRRLGRGRRRRAWCRSPTATTAAARCASPPRAAASSGSSPARPHLARRRTSGESSSSSDGVLTRTVARDRARCSTCSPATSPATRRGRRRPPSRSPPRAARDPGRLRIAHDDAQRRSAPTARPESCARVRDAAALLARSATRSSEVDPPWPRRRRCCSCSPPSSARPSRSAIAFAAMLAGREPAGGRHRGAELGDLGARARASTRSSYLRRCWPAPGASRARSSRLARDYDALLTPALAERAAADRRRCDADGPDPMADLRALRASSRRSRRCSTSPGQPAITVPLYIGDDGLPRRASSSSAARAARRAAGARARSSRRRSRGPTAGPRSPASA